MSDLLLNHNLSKSKPGDIVSEVARERTLTVLRRLDAKRNRIVLQFLQDAHLISELNVVIDLHGADLSGDDLSQVNLSDVDLTDTHLSDVNLTRADLRGTNLTRADLRGTHMLTGADLTGADLTEADLRGAHLIDEDWRKVTLQGANLSGAFLNGAFLDGTNLQDANLQDADLRAARNLTQQQLDQVSTCKGAILPKGLTCPQ